MLKKDVVTDRQTDKRTDIRTYIAAFAAEKLMLKHSKLYLNFTKTSKLSSVY